MGHSEITRRSLLTAAAGAVLVGAARPVSVLAALTAPPPTLLRERRLGELRAGTHTIDLGGPIDMLGLRWSEPAATAGRAAAAQRRWALEPVGHRLRPRAWPGRRSPHRLTCRRSDLARRGERRAVAARRDDLGCALGADRRERQDRRRQGSTDLQLAGAGRPGTGGRRRTAADHRPHGLGPGGLPSKGGSRIRDGEAGLRASHGEPQLATAPGRCRRCCAPSMPSTATSTAGTTSATTS